MFSTHYSTKGSYFTSVEGVMKIALTTTFGRVIGRKPVNCRTNTFHITHLNISSGGRCGNYFFDNIL